MQQIIRCEASRDSSHTLKAEVVYFVETGGDICGGIHYHNERLFIKSCSASRDIARKDFFFFQPNMQLDHPNLAHIAPILASDKIYQ